ncbi:MAG: hypothetical protein MUO34_00925 [Ignavibacteriaceae bacterium]|nr:hypothetical protein [Ignavibacteriaceae bacterium]
MKKLLIVLIPFVLIVITTSCNSGYSTPESVIYANAKYMTEKNLEAVMETIHPESPVFESTKKIVTQIFQQFDLSYKIEKIEIIEENADEAIVKFVQLTTKLTNFQFNNNRLTGVHTLRKDGNSWKIFSTRTENLEYLQ